MLQPGLLLGVATNRSSSWNIKPLLILVDTLKFKLSQRVHRHRKCLKSLNLKKQNKTRNVLTLMQMLYLEDWKKCWSEIYRIKDKLGLEQTRIRIDAHMHGLKKVPTFHKMIKGATPTDKPPYLHEIRVCEFLIFIFLACPYRAHNLDLTAKWLQDDVKILRIYQHKNPLQTPESLVPGPWNSIIHVLHFLLKNMYLLTLFSFSHERFVILNLLMLKLKSNAFQYILGNENVNFIIKIYNRNTTKL